LVLACPVLASDGTEDEGIQELSRDAQRVLEECREEQDGMWEHDALRYGRIRDLALKSWLIVDFWVPTMYAAWKFFRHPDATEDNRDSSIIAWIRSHASVPVIDLGIAGIVGIHLVTTEQDQLPLLAPRARQIRVELAETLRRRKLTSWPRIVRTASAEWVAGGAARFALDLATAMSAIADRVTDTFKVVQSQMAELEAAQAAQAKAARRAERADAVPSVPLSQYEERLGGEAARYRALEERFATVRAERDAIASRESRLRARIEALTAKLETAQQRLEELDASQSTTRSEADSEIPTQATEVPDPQPVARDALAGRVVLLFTGRSAGDVREAMKQSLLEYGAADVVVYWADKERGPAVVPADALVVIEVRYMSHTNSEAFVRLAEKSGAWYCVVERGSALIGREVALRFSER